MAKIAFLQTLITENMSIMLFSALLKERGHQCKVFMYDLEQANFIDRLKEFDPDLIAVSSIHHTYAEDIKLAKAAKENFRAPIIFGGICPTLSPEILEHPAIDIICRGEGEGAMLDLVDAIENGKEYTGIPNLEIKREGQIFKNKQRPVIDPLDTLPDPDREIYYERSNFLRQYPTKKFIAGRGCPFSCAFCVTPAQRAISGDGKFTRKQGIDKLIEEIKGVRDRYSLKAVSFIDDIFTVDRRWVGPFLERYRREINLPFNCNIRAETVTEETIKIMAEANCKVVLFGIESGDQDVRSGILKKSVSDNRLLLLSQWLKKYKIKFVGNNILGIPGETLEDALMTLRFNTKMKTDYPWAYFFIPYPHTEMAEENIFYKKSTGDASTNWMPNSTLTTAMVDAKDRKQMENLQQLFFWGAKFPFLQPLMKRIIKLPKNSVFWFLHMISYAYCSKRSYMISLFWIAKFGLHNRKLMKNRITFEEKVKRNTPPSPPLERKRDAVPAAVSLMSSSQEPQPLHRRERSF